MPDWEAVHVILPESSGINNTPIGEGGGGPRDIGSFFPPRLTHWTSSKDSKKALSRSRWWNLHRCRNVWSDGLKGCRI